MISTFFFLHESYAYTILDRKTKRLRKETGNQNLRSALDTGRSNKGIFKLAIVRPTKMLFFSPIVSLMSLYMAILYGYLYLIFTILPSMFEYEYGFSTGDVGLTYLGIGVGSAIGLLTNALVSDRLAMRLRQQQGGEHKPEFRLPPMMFPCFLVPLGLFWFGWTADFHRHWILPIIGTGFFGFGVVVVFVGRDAPWPHIMHTANGTNRWPYKCTLSTLSGCMLRLPPPPAQSSDLFWALCSLLVGETSLTLWALAGGVRCWGSSPWL